MKIKTRSKYTKDKGENPICLAVEIEHREHKVSSVHAQGEKDLYLKAPDLKVDSSRLSFRW